MIPRFRDSLAAGLCLAVLALAGLGSGCGDKKDGATPSAGGSGGTTASSAATTLKVGLITPGAISDKGWNASANDGLQRIKADVGAEISPPVENVTTSSVEGDLRNLAQQGETLVFLHGSEFDEGAKSVAPSFPKTTFVVIGGRSVGPNLNPIQFSAGEATYLAGMLAGGMTKTGKIGCIGAAKIPIVEESFKSFEKGAKAVRPDVVVQIAFTGDENDPGKAKQQAQAFIGQGVDVLMHNANAGGQGVAQAVTEKPGTMFIGANADQSDLATSQNLGSFIVDAPNAYVAVAKAVQGGTAANKAFPAGLKDKAVGFKFNDKFQGTIPADLKAKMEQAEKDLIDGKIDPKG